jgi:hypothetical protein
LFTIATVVGKSSFTVLLVNNGEIVYIPIGITTAATTTIITTVSTFLFILIWPYGYIKEIKPVKEMN